jgi:RNA polymerase sigma-70 factor (ECF subfamily)
MNITADTFNSVYLNFYKRLFAFSKKIVKDDNRAHEVVQDVFIKLWKQDFDNLESYLTQWLFTVCRNASIKVLKKNQRYVEAFEDESLDECRDPYNELDFQESLKLLKKCMRKLTPRQKEVIKYRFFKDLNYEQSAKKMKTSSGNVGFLQSTALKELKVMLNREINK